MTAPVLRDALGHAWIFDPARRSYRRADRPATDPRRSSRVHIEVVYGPVTEEEQ